MFFKTKAIVLHQIKYSDTSLITTLYTEVFGRRSFLIQGVYKKKSKFPAVFFQPLTLLEIEVSISHKRDLQRINDAIIYQPFHSIPFDPKKSAIALFLSELFYKTLKEEESNPAMFEFLNSSIQFLDRMESGSANFHLWLMVHFSKYLGFYPENNYSSVNCMFDAMNGRFFNPVLVNTSPAVRELSRWIHTLQSLSPENLMDMELNHIMRNSITEALIEYYHIHLGNLGNLKSMPVLQGLFSDY